MADQFKEIAEIPRDFLRDGTQFLNRCTKRKSLFVHMRNTILHFFCAGLRRLLDHLADRTGFAADKREFIKISQAVGMGFVVMGVIGYVVKLSELPEIWP